MKRIYQWENSQRGIHNDVYECANGVKVLHSINPASRDFYMSVVLRAGSSFEQKAGVPTGTAHFLEHMLRNPNNVFPTQASIDAYEYGNSKRPRLNTNAATSKKYMYVYGYSNIKGAHRLLKRISSEVSYPTGIFEKYIEKDRKIIIAEMTEDLKPEKDPVHMYEQFMIGDELPNLAARIIGDREDVERLTADDLREFHRKTFVAKNIVLSVQSPAKLSKSIVKKIEEIGAVFPFERRKIVPVAESLKNAYNVGFFHDPREEGTFVSFNYFKKVTKQVNYREMVLYELLTDLLHKLGYDVLREKKGLVYAFQSFRVTHLAFMYDIYGFKCSTDVHNFQRLLDEVDDLIYSGVIKFLQSRGGQKWFDHGISRFIFPNTASYDPEYAEKRSIEILEGREILETDKAIEVAKKLNIRDLVEFIEKDVTSVPPRVWIVSPMKEEEVMPDVRKSAVEERWGR